jgi:hypothetical protein
VELAKSMKAHRRDLLLKTTVADIDTNITPEEQAFDDQLWVVLLGDVPEDLCTEDLGEIWKLITLMQRRRPLYSSTQRLLAHNCFYHNVRRSLVHILLVNGLHEQSIARTLGSLRVFPWRRRCAEEGRSR